MSATVLKRQVLILNQNYEPLSVITARKAVILLFLGKAEIIEKYDHLRIRSISTSLPFPSIVRLSHYVRIPRKGVILSRRNILKRDSFTCQYCGTPGGQLTVDHIIPRKRGGKDTWENLVCACVQCNNKKGDRSPEQAGMKLLSTPRKPSYLFFIYQDIKTMDERWKPYLYLS